MISSTCSKERTPCGISLDKVRLSKTALEKILGGSAKFIEVGTQKSLMTKGSSRIGDGKCVNACAYGKGEQDFMDSIINGMLKQNLSNS